RERPEMISTGQPARNPPATRGRVAPRTGVRSEKSGRQTRLPSTATLPLRDTPGVRRASRRRKRSARSRGHGRGQFLACGGEKLEGGLGHLGRAMAVARELDVDQAGVLVVGQYPQDRDEIQFALAEHQMFVFAAANVFDVNVADQVRKFAVDLAERRRFG